MIASIMIRAQLNAFGIGIRNSIEIFLLFPVCFSLVFLLIINLTNGLRLHQFLWSKSTEANKSQKTDANGAH